MKLKHSSTLLMFLLAGCAALSPHGDCRRLHGDPAPPGEGRPIAIRHDTRFVNVEGGEMIRFQEFGWHFNVARTVESLDLREIAPPGLLHGPLTVSVSPDPRCLSVP